MSGKVDQLFRDAKGTPLFLEKRREAHG